MAKGSLVNKAILVPAALAISAIAPWAIVPLLMAGGLFLCFEGFEKIWHALVHRKDEDAHRQELREAIVDPAVDLRTVEKDKIKGAIRTDFILSAEIIVIALGTVGTAPFGVRVAVLVGIALLMTVGVYGLVAAHREARRCRLYLEPARGQRRAHAAAARPRARPAGLRALADEDAVRPGHGGDVSRRWRHPRARHPWVAHAIEHFAAPLAAWPAWARCCRS